MPNDPTIPAAAVAGEDLLTKPYAPTPTVYDDPPRIEYIKRDWLVDVPKRQDAPAGDVAELVEAFDNAAQRWGEDLSSCILEERKRAHLRHQSAKAALLAGIAAITADRDEARRQFSDAASAVCDVGARWTEVCKERDEARRERDTAIQDTLAGITPWLECQSRMRAAEADRDALAERLRCATKALTIYANPYKWSVDGTFLEPDIENVRSAGGSIAYDALAEIATLTQAAAATETGEPKL